jgi:ketosteroid isomerase-like protein
VTDRSDRIREGFAGLDRGSVAAFQTLFSADARWLGIPGSGSDGATPI